MKINEFTKYDLVVIDFMSGEDQVNGLDLATKDDIEVLQTGTGSIPTIFNIERDSLHGAIFLSHMRHSGVNFEDVSGEGHVPPIMQGKSAMMRDAAEEQGFDVTELPFTTDLDESPDSNELDRDSIDSLMGKYGWIMYVGWSRDDLEHVMYKNIDKNNRESDYRFLVMNKETGSWTTQVSKRNDAMATESGDLPELPHFLKGLKASQAQRR